MNPDNDFYKTGSTAVAEPPPRKAPAAGAGQKPPEGSAAWTGPEFVEHPHKTNWFISLAGATVILAALVYLLTKEIFATVTIVVLGVIVGVFASRKPRTVNYSISSSALKIGDKNYPYSQFKSFSVLHEGNLSSVNLIPIKKFMPPVSAYFAPEDEKIIAEALGKHLPYEERKVAFIDRLSHRLGF